VAGNFFLAGIFFVGGNVLVASKLLFFEVSDKNKKIRFSPLSPLFLLFFSAFSRLFSAFSPLFLRFFSAFH